MTETIGRARAILEGRLSELEREAASLRDAIASLQTAAAAQAAAPTLTPPPAGNPAPARAPGGRARRAKPGERERQLLERIRSHPAERVAEHARALGIRPQQAYPLLRRLEDKGAIVKTGDGYRPAPAPTTT